LLSFNTIYDVAAVDHDDNDDDGDDDGNYDGLNNYV
jgi:hypothetical protein